MSILKLSLCRYRLSCPCSSGCARGCCPALASCSSWQADCSPCCFRRDDYLLCKNGIILLVLAFLISDGLPLLAVQGLGKLQDVNAAMKNFIHS